MKTRKKIGIGKEGQIHKEFATLVKKYEFHKKLDCIFWSYNASGEKRTMITGALLKAKGLKTGIPDYEFRFARDKILHSLFIEFKYGKGKQAESQIDFQNKIEIFDNAYYEIARSVEEGIKILQKYKLIIE